MFLQNLAEIFMLNMNKPKEIECLHVSTWKENISEIQNTKHYNFPKLGRTKGKENFKDGNGSRNSKVGKENISAGFTVT